MSHGSRRIANSGFTLTELVVLIVVIAFLAGLFFYLFSSFREKSRRVQCLANQHTLWYACAEIGLLPCDSFHPNLPYGHLVGPSYSPSREYPARKNGWLNGYPNITPDLFICPSMANIVKPANCLTNITETNSCYVVFTGRQADEGSKIFICDMNGFNAIPSPTTNGWGGNHKGKGGNMVFVSGAGLWVDSSAITNSVYTVAFSLGINSDNPQKILKY